LLALQNNLAGTLEQKGEFAEAEKLYGEVLAVHGRLFGDEHDDTRIVLTNFAEFYEKLGQARPQRGGAGVAPAVAADRRALSRARPGHRRQPRTLNSRSRSCRAWRPWS
jgi:hypothetical protein